MADGKGAGEAPKPQHAAKKADDAPAQAGKAGPNVRKVVLDTNALMLVHQFKIDILSEVARLMDWDYSFVITDRAIWELDNLLASRKRGFKSARLAKAYLEHIKAKGVLEIIHSEMKVDDWIVKFAADNPGTVVLTNDIILKKRLREKKTKLIGLRSKDHLDIM
ncbi:MAG: PIN domain-containing protein [Candidatus Micrarchaeia archaeon]